MQTISRVGGKNSKAAVKPQSQSRRHSGRNIRPVIQDCVSEQELKRTFVLFRNGQPGETQEEIRCAFENGQLFLTTNGDGSSAFKPLTMDVAWDWCRANYTGTLTPDEQWVLLNLYSRRPNMFGGNSFSEDEMLLFQAAAESRKEDVKQWITRTLHEALERAGSQQQQPAQVQQEPPELFLRIEDAVNKMVAFLCIMGKKLADCYEASDRATANQEAIGTTLLTRECAKTLFDSFEDAQRKAAFRETGAMNAAVQLSHALEAACDLAYTLATALEDEEPIEKGEPINASGYIVMASKLKDALQRGIDEAWEELDNFLGE